MTNSQLRDGDPNEHVDSRATNDNRFAWGGGSTGRYVLAFGLAGAVIGLGVIGFLAAHGGLGPLW